jgi:hypothetical protein
MTALTPAMPNEILRRLPFNCFVRELAVPTPPPDDSRLRIHRRVTVCGCVRMPDDTLAVGAAVTIEGLPNAPRVAPRKGRRTSLLNPADAAAQKPAPTTARADGSYFFMDLPPGAYRLCAELTQIDWAGTSRLQAQAQTRIALAGNLSEKASPPIFVPLELTVCSSTPTGRSDAATEPDHGLKG